MLAECVRGTLIACATHAAATSPQRKQKTERAGCPRWRRGLVVAIPQCQATNRGLVRVGDSMITAALAVGEVRIEREVVPRRGAIAGADAIDVAGRFDAARMQQVFDDVVARFVNVGVDPMRGQIPSVHREPHADIAAHLAHPDPLLLVAQRREPQPQVQALVDRASRALHAPRPGCG